MRRTAPAPGAGPPSRVRPPAVAGRFYPADPGQLRASVDRLLATSPGGPPLEGLRALVVPHAGYEYSGPIAARGYARLLPHRRRVSRVVLLGPAHRVALRGLALPSSRAWLTPLGEVPLDRAGRERLLALPQVSLMDGAHAAEHCLEVQLPFLQRVLADFVILPLVAGDATTDEVEQALALASGGDETLIVVSSDLSHYHADAVARRLDEATSRAIERLDPRAIGPQQACGCVPLRGLLEMAGRRGWEVRRLGLGNSGDTAGPRDEVVGYGAYALIGAAAGEPSPGSELAGAPRGPGRD